MRRGMRGLAAPTPRALDMGEIAVLQDEGDLVLPANVFDLAGRGVRFSRNASGGFNLSPIDAAFQSPLGERLDLADDDGVATALAFGFDFFSGSYTQVFVNSDGNLTFDEADRASTARDLARLLSGPPRLAPFLADLDPSAGGAVFAREGSTGLTVTWCAVPGFDQPETTTVQISLLPDASIEVRYDTAIGLGDAIVGLSPGRTTNFEPLDVSVGGTSADPSTALGERFARATDLDLVALARKFYAGHADAYDQLVVWTDTSYVRDAFAFELTVANEVKGIGVDLYDLSSDYGSRGALRSLVMMDTLTKYPDDPARKFHGENTTLSLLGQEAGHRWLAFLRFLDHDRRVSDALLGRDEAHWSFFMDSDASVMEGNDIEDLGGGSFRTVAAVTRYSLLDQYAMGLVNDFDVPPFFYVESPVNVSGSDDPASAPRVGVTFNGTRRDVLIQDVVDVMGPRVPSAEDAPKMHRQAFVYVVGARRDADPAAIDKVDRIRRAWESFFLAATDGRMQARTRLGG